MKVNDEIKQMAAEFKLAYEMNIGPDEAMLLMIEKYGREKVAVSLEYIAEQEGFSEEAVSASKILSEVSGMVDTISEQLDWTKYKKKDGKRAFAILATLAEFEPFIKKNDKSGKIYTLIGALLGASIEEN